MEDELDRWSKAEDAIGRLLDHLRGVVSSEAVDAVQHYLDHAEYEMALEGLILEAMRARPGGVDVEWSEFTQLAAELGLDRETAFEPLFWDKFVVYSRTWPER